MSSAPYPRQEKAHGADAVKISSLQVIRSTYYLARRSLFVPIPSNPKFIVNCKYVTSSAALMMYASSSANPAPGATTAHSPKMAESLNTTWENCDYMKDHVQNRDHCLGSILYSQVRRQQALGARVP